MEKYNELLNLVEQVKNDAEKFFNKGNKAAGTRLRKSMQEIKRLAQEVRLQVSEIKKDK